MVETDYSSDILDMATIAWRIEHPRPPEMQDYIDLVRTSQRLNAPMPQWPEGQAIGTACKWAIIMPPPGSLEREWYRTLQAMIGKYQLPQPLKIVVNNEQRDLLNAALWFVPGPLMLVTHSILQWRTPSPYVPCGVWWDSRPVVPVRNFSIPACDNAFLAAHLAMNPSVALGDLTGKQCCRCGNGAVEWDRDAVPYCAACWPKWSTEWMTYRSQWIARADSQTAF